MVSEDAGERHREALTVADGASMLEIAVVSDRGRRAENQDGFRVVPLDGDAGCALLLADGMGGHVGGKQASFTALTAATERILGPGDHHVALSEAFLEADSAVGGLRGDGALTGTTLVVALISNSQVRVGNVGDSRAYIIRGPHVVVVTQDHSLIEEQIRAGAIAPEDAPGLPGRNILTRAVTGEHAPADYFDVSLAPGDVLVLCSDGLWGVLDDDRMRELFNSSDGIIELAERACDAALEAGSNDNVTLVACRIAASA